MNPKKIQEKVQLSTYCDSNICFVCLLPLLLPLRISYELSYYVVREVKARLIRASDVEAPAVKKVMSVW